MSHHRGTRERTRVSAGRSTWTIALALTLALWLLASPVFASAHSKPGVVVVSANAAGRDTLKVTVPVKKGKGCAGKVKVSMGAVHGNAKLAARKGLCVALVHLKLPISDFGKVVAFKVRIAGAKGVSRFILTVHLRLIPPPNHTPTGPTTPTETPTGQTQDGTYRWVLDEGKEGKGSPWSEGEMIVKGGKLAAIGLYTGAAVTVECAGGIGKVTLDYNPIGPLISGGLGNGMFSAVYMTHAYKVEFSGTLKYDPGTQKPYGEMNFSMVGESEGKVCRREAHGTNLVYTP